MDGQQRGGEEEGVGGPETRRRPTATKGRPSLISTDDDQGAERRHSVNQGSIARTDIKPGRGGEVCRSVQKRRRVADRKTLPLSPRESGPQNVGTWWVVAAATATAEEDDDEDGDKGKKAKRRREKERRRNEQERKLRTAESRIRRQARATATASALRRVLRVMAGATAGRR